MASTSLKLKSEYDNDPTVLLAKSLKEEGVLDLPDEVRALHKAVERMADENSSLRRSLDAQTATQKAELSEQVATAEAQLRQDLGGLAEQIADKVMHVNRQPALR